VARRNRIIKNSAICRRGCSGESCPDFGYATFQPPVLQMAFFILAYMEQSSYYAVIPAFVRYCKDVPDGAKLLYGEITALCNEQGYCWASNKYFSDLYGKSGDTISRWISKLAQAGFILTIVDKPSPQKYRKGIGKNP